MAIQTRAISLPRFQSVTNGLALFSMFFGAGNVVFPLIVGQVVQGKLFYALMGLIITAVLVPISGVISTALFEGDYYTFFKRLGKIPGWTIILMLFALIGPFAGIPRLVDLCYSSIKIYIPTLKLGSFSAASCLIIYLFTFKKNRILETLGIVLTPILLGSLFIIIIKGVFFSKGSFSPSSAGGQEIVSAFVYGLKEGYNTLDLLASFFFSSLIYNRLKTTNGDKPSSRHLLASMLKSSSIGAFLLSIVYFGFAAVAALYSDQLKTVSQDQLLGSIGHIVLGPYAGFVVCLTIIFSCLTTAIALTVLCADFFRDRIPLKKKPSYEFCLVLILIITWAVSILEFSGIVSLLAPILIVCYPSLMTLCVMNILNKIYDVKMVKLPVFGVFSIMMVASCLPEIRKLFSF